jgi:predicted nuclease of predicted toxin-antitoxin system
MRLYLDEDIASRHLIGALQKAGHDVTSARDINLLGESDTLQLTQAVRDVRVCVTKNHRDFEQLHDLVLLTGGSHPGIFTIRSDNDRPREIKPSQIINAIKNVLTILSSVRNHVVCLNEWR